MVGHRCKNCIWFDIEHKSINYLTLPELVGKYKVGYCRKHFPVVQLLGNKYWGNWPLVDMDDFCGEFKKQE